MKVTTLFLILLLHKLDISAKVAIIGKGLGAALCSHYLHQMIPDIEIDIYDHKPKYQGLNRSLIHCKNLNMNQIIEEKKFFVYDAYYRSMVKDGDKIRLHDIEELSEIDPTGFSKLQEFVKDQLTKFEKIYEIQNDGKTFKTVRELLFALDPNFEDYYINTKENISSLLNKILSPEPVSTAILNFVKTGLMDSCLADMSIHAFAGLETLMFSELTGNLVQITEEERYVLKKLFKKRDNFIKKDILKIIRSKNEKINYIVGSDNRQIEYDFVILATVTAAKIKIKYFAEENVNIFKYRDGKTTYVIGNLLDEFKNLPSDSNFIVNLDKNHSFIKIPDSNLYGITKICLDASKTEILEYINPYEIRSYATLTTCPDFSSKDKSVRDAKFELGENLYNVYAVDAISMATDEMLTISAKNIALLIREKILENINEQEKTEENDTTGHVPLIESNLTKKAPKTRNNRKKKSAQKG